MSKIVQFNLPIAAIKKQFIASVIMAVLVYTCLWIENTYRILNYNVVFVLLLVALTAAPAGWAPVVVAFIAFRGFDILKPFPVGWLDARIEGGWGVLLDDVVAGVYALAVVQILFVWRPWE